MLSHFCHRMLSHFPHSNTLHWGHSNTSFIGVNFINRWDQIYHSLGVNFIHWGQIYHSLTSTPSFIEVNFIICRGQLYHSWRSNLSFVRLKFIIRGGQLYHSLGVNFYHLSHRSICRIMVNRIKCTTESFLDLYFWVQITSRSTLPFIWGRQNKVPFFR